MLFDHIAVPPLDIGLADRSAGGMVVLTRNVYLGTELDAILGIADPSLIPDELPLDHAGLAAVLGLEARVR